MAANLSVFKDTLQQHAMAYEKTQATLIDSLFEETPFLRTVPFMESTHGLKNQYEEITQINGAQFRQINAPMVEMDTKTCLKSFDLQALSGEMKVTFERAQMVAPKAGSKVKSVEEYFKKRTPAILNDGGKKVEESLIYDTLLPSVLDFSAGKTGNDQTFIDKGGAADGNLFHLLLVRQKKEINCGLFSPMGENKDELMQMTWLNGGQEHSLVNAGQDTGKPGYAAYWNAYLGYQIAMPQYVGAIFNINPNNPDTMLTMADFDKVCAMMKANPADTVAVGSRFLINAMRSLKWGTIQLGSGDMNLISGYDRINSIPLIGTDQMLNGKESVVDTNV